MAGTGLLPRPAKPKFYAGSYILSHLCRISLLRAEELGAEVVFPNPQLQGLPNRFLVEVPAEDKERVIAIGREIERATREEFKRLAGTIVARMGLEVSPEFWEQIENTLETYWVPLPVGKRIMLKRTGNYVSDGSIKSLRKFKQLKQPPAIVVCLLGA